MWQFFYIKIGKEKLCGNSNNNDHLQSKLLRMMVFLSNCENVVDDMISLKHVIV